MMNFNEELTLVRETNAIAIPSGEERILPAGTRAVISQALGGSATIRTDSGLFRLLGEDWDALGEAVKAELENSVIKNDVNGSDEPFSEDRVWEAIKHCFDPEIPINIVDLGLIYDLKISDPDPKGKRKVNVKMTLTAQGCGMGPVIANDAKERIESIEEVSSAQVDIVWDPPWTPHMISDAGRQKLGLE